MKRFLLSMLLVLLSIMFTGCSSRSKINSIFDAYKTETTEKIPYVRYDTLTIDKTTIDFKEVLEKNKCEGIFHEVYVIKDNTVWFGFSSVDAAENGNRKWNIASVNVDGNNFNVCYSGVFCSEIGSDKSYVQKNNNTSEGYQVDNGFYHDGKIVLTDRVKTIEYDLQSKITTEFVQKDYSYPSLPIQIEIIDRHNILFSEGTTQKVFNVNQGKQNGGVFEKLIELEEEKNWEGKSYLSELFDKIQVVDDQIYIICRVINWDGETHAIVFQYDFETNSSKYAFHCFMDDIIGNRLYVVAAI